MVQEHGGLWDWISLQGNNTRLGRKSVGVEVPDSGVYSRCPLDDCLVVDVPGVSAARKRGAVAVRAVLLDERVTARRPRTAVASRVHQRYHRRSRISRRNDEAPVGTCSTSGFDWGATDTDTSTVKRHTQTRLGRSSTPDAGASKSVGAKVIHFPNDSRLSPCCCVMLAVGRAVGHHNH